MKQLVLSLILFAILGCNREEKRNEISDSGKFYAEVKQRSVLIGKIENINEFPNAPREIQLSVDDITVSHQHSFKTKIDDSGKFVFDIPLYHSINTYLNYGDGRITPYLFTNDTLHLSCQIGTKGYKIGIVSGEFDKRHDKFETEFFKQYNWIHTKQISKFRRTLLKDLTPFELKKQYLDFEKNLLKRIDVRIKRDTLNQLLSDYLHYTATYSIYRSIIQVGKEMDNADEKQQFLAFLNDSTIFNKKAMLTSKYKLFLNAYHFNVEKRERISVMHKLKTQEQVSQEFVTKSVHEAFKLRKGLWAEYIAASKLFSMAFKEELWTQSSTDYFTELINETFTDDYIRQLLLSKCYQTGEKAEEIDTLTIPKEAELNKYSSLSGKDLFDKILDDNKGKVIYIDIWATWCSPCKKNMPHSKRLHEMFNDKNVSFVYLCTNSKEKEWNIVIKQYQITGEHFLLTPEQSIYLKDKFQNEGIPRYILVDKSGEIINDNAPDPDSEKIVNEINKLVCE